MADYTGTASGAATGAAAGAPLGPLGMAAGALIGAGLGFVGDSSRNRKAKRAKRLAEANLARQRREALHANLQDRENTLEAGDEAARNRQSRNTADAYSFASSAYDDDLRQIERLKGRRLSAIDRQRDTINWNADFANSMTRYAEQIAKIDAMIAILGAAQGGITEIAAVNNRNNRQRDNAAIGGGVGVN